MSEWVLKDTQGRKWTVDQFRNGASPSFRVLHFGTMRVASGRDDTQRDLYDLIPQMCEDLNAAEEARRGADTQPESKWLVECGATAKSRASFHGRWVLTLAPKSTGICESCGRTIFGNTEHRV